VNAPISDGASYLVCTSDPEPVHCAERMISLPVWGSAGSLRGRKMNEMRASINYNFNEANVNCPVLNLLRPWSGNGGNPRLRPWIADAVDVSLEKYFGRDAYVSLAGYYKNLKTYIYEQQVLQDFTGFPTNSGVVPPVSTRGLRQHLEQRRRRRSSTASNSPARFRSASSPTSARRLRPAGQLQLHRKRDRAQSG
jgi:outer membrane receptor protein involved in Fe transport